MVQTCLKKTDLRSKLCSYLETTENVGPGPIFSKKLRALNSGKYT